MLRVHVEHDAGVDGAGVDVHADGALVPFWKVLNAMDRLRLARVQSLEPLLQKTARTALSDCPV